jgi:predicted nucleotidyltransferase
MKFDIKKRNLSKNYNYDSEILNQAYEFTKRLKNEFSDLILSVVLFGSSVKDNDKKSNDIDLFILIDDVKIILNEEMIQSYKIIAYKIAEDINPKFHVTTLRYTSFWEYIRGADPVVVNLLRDGFALFDNGNLFETLQILLFQGRIRPTRESIWAYYLRAPKSIERSKYKIAHAIVDLYWSVVDSAHSVVMSCGEVPPSPAHLARIFREKLVKNNIFSEEDALVIEKFYFLMKKITSKNDFLKVSGVDYDSLYIEANDFVDKMREFLEKNDFQK